MADKSSCLSSPFLLRQTQLSRLGVLPTRPGNRGLTQLRHVIVDTNTVNLNSYLSLLCVDVDLRVLYVEGMSREGRFTFPKIAVSLGLRQ